MTTPSYPKPAYPYNSDSYEHQYGDSSPVAQEEWSNFLHRRKELLDIMMGQMQALAPAIDPHAQQSGDPTLGMATQGIMGDTQAGQRDAETRRDLLARADFWRVPGAEQMSVDQLQNAIGARRSEIKQAPQTTLGSVATAFGGAAEQAVSTVARLTGNLVNNVVGEAPFVGETLRSILATDRAKNWLYNWSSKLDESSMMLQAQQPEQDKTASQFLTAAGKTAGYVLPAVAAWQAFGALGAAVETPAWMGWASTPLTRLAFRGALSSAVLDDPNASTSEKVVNFGIGAILGAAQPLGFFGAGVGGAAIGAGVGGGIGDTEAERRRNQILGGIGGFALFGLAPWAAQSFAKVRHDIPSPFDQKLGDAIDAEASRPHPEGFVYGEVTNPQGLLGVGPPKNDIGQVSGNPPPQMHLLGRGTGEINSAEELSALMRSEPTRSIGPSGQLEIGAPQQPRGLLPAVSDVPSNARMELQIARDLANGRDLAPVSDYYQSLQSKIDLKTFESQRNAPLEAKGLVAVSSGPSHLLGSKVATADGQPLRVYHGTGVDFEAFDPQALDPDALYGPGFYHTESPEIATGYAGGVDPVAQMNVTDYRQQLADATQQGAPPEFIQTLQERLQRYEAELIKQPSNIRPAFLDIKRPFDIDAKYQPQEVEQLLSSLKQSYPEYQWDEARKTLTDPNVAIDESGLPRGNGPTSGDDLYNTLINTQLTTEPQGPQRLVGDWLNVGSSRILGKVGLNQALESLGYDGITHIGGARTGNDPHRVWIAFRPEQVHMPYAVDPLSTRESIGTAESMTKQATVLESAMMPDAVGKAQVTDADVTTATKATNPGGVSILRNVGRPLDVMAEHPDVHFVQRKDGGLDAMIGEATPEMVQDYERFGTYEGQVVLTQRGMEGTVLSVNGRGVATVARRGGGPPLRIKASNLLPSRYGDPVRNAPDIWNSFKADLLGYMNEEAAKASMKPIEDIWDHRVGDMMQSRLNDYMDRLGVNDPADRQAIDAYVNRQFVEETKNLDPESRDLQAQMTDLAVAAENEAADEAIVSTEEKASAKGFIWIKTPGEAGGVLRDNLNVQAGLEIPIASESDVDGFLRNVDRAAPDLTPTGAGVPAEVAENIPTDTTIDPAPGIDNTVSAYDEAGWRKFATESVGIRELGAQHAQTLRANISEATQRINDIIDKTDAERAAAQARRAAVGGGNVPPRLPPSDPTGAGFDPWPRRLPGEAETLGSQFEALKKNDLPKYEQIRDKYKHAVYRYTRYLMAGLEKTLVDAGLDLGRAWKHYEALETSRVYADNEAYPWLKEYDGVMKEFPREILRDGTVTRIHEIENTSSRLAEWSKLMDRGYTKEDITGFIAADDKITDFNHRWFEFLTGDPTFALSADREIYRYMSHVRARQAYGAKDPYDSTGWLSPHTQYFAEFAREGNLQFRVMDPRELGNYMVRAGMFKKYQAGPWEDFVSTWQDPRVPEPIQGIMTDHAHAMRYGYDASGDTMVQAVKTGLDKILGLKITDREASQIIGAPVSGMYMSMLAGRASIFFRDAIQPLLALAKVRTNHMRGVYVDVLKGAANRSVLEDIYSRGLRGGWITHDVPPIEGLGVFEEPAGLRNNDLLGLTPEQSARRELFAQIGDRVADLPAWLVRPTESNLSTLKLYGKQQQLQRAIVGEAAYRQADVALQEYRAAETTAALAGDASLAIPYKEFAKKSFFSSYEPAIQQRLNELVDAGQDEEAKMLFARETVKWSQFQYGRRELPKILRSNFGKMLYAFGNFSGQFAEGMVSALANGEPVHKARYLMTIGAVSGLLSYLGSKSGWSFGKWGWGSALRYSGGPAADYVAQLVASAGAAVALSDDRKPAPWQNDAFRATMQDGILPSPMTFFPYAGYLRSAAEYSAAAQGLNPVEQAARYTVTGDRGSRIDLNRESQQRSDEFVRAIEQRALQQGGLPPGVLSPNGGLMPGRPGNRDAQAQPGQPETLQQQYLRGVGHPGNGGRQ